MKRSAVILFLLMLSCFAMGAEEVSEPVNVPKEHAKDVDALAKYIKENCRDTRHMLWSLQNWLSENVMYDLSVTDVQTKYNATDLANWTLRNRKGVCANYSSLFSEVSNRMGIPMFIIEGYTPKDNIVGEGGHAWCACIIDSVPYMFDPTWCSGYFEPGNPRAYHPRLESRFFMVSPDSLKESHIPYDPLMRLGAGVSSDQTSGDTMNPPAVDGTGWLDSLTAYFRLDSLEQKKALYERLVRNGDGNKLAVRYTENVKHYIDACTLEEQQRRCERIIYQISDLHNRIVDLNFVSPGAERSMQNKIGELKAELNDILSRTNSVTTPVLAKPARQISSYVQNLIRKVDKCGTMLKKKKK